MRFPEPLESAFLQEHTADMLKQWRFSIAFGALLFTAWAWWDLRTNPQFATQIWIIRFGFAVPALTLLLALTYVRAMQTPRALQWILSLAVGVAAVSILAMRELMGMGVHRTNYYPDLMLVQAFAYTFIRLQFIYPTVVCWTAFVAYVTLSSLDPRVPAAHLAFGCFYLASTNVIGMFACYFIERAHRSEFRQRVQNLELLAKVTAEREAADRANRDKSRFLAAASHDLKQPMHALGLWVRNLRNAVQRGNAADVTEKVRTIEDSVGALASSFDGILQISRFDAGSIEPHLEDVPLAPLLQQIELVFRPLAADKNLTFAIVREGDAPASARTDRVLIDRVLKNLVANAIKFTERGGVRIVIRAENVQLVIAVTDTGMGIPAEFREDIFKEFFQIGNVERDRRRGLGLGLSIVKRILANLPDHTLELQSTPGEGTTFRLAVPAGATRIFEADHVAASQSTEWLARRYVLLVEDDKAVREGLVELLQSFGCQLDAAVSAQHALEVVAKSERRPDLVITDQRLPDGRTGIGLAAEIRGLLEREVPVLLVTGDSAQPSDLEPLGPRALLLTKPVNPDRLLEAMASLVGANAALSEASVRAGPPRSRAVPGS